MGSLIQSVIEAEIHPNGHNGYGKQRPIRAGQPWNGIDMHQGKHIVEHPEGRMKKKLPYDCR